MKDLRIAPVRTGAKDAPAPVAMNQTEIVLLDLDAFVLHPFNDNADRGGHAPVELDDHAAMQRKHAPRGSQSALVCRERGRGEMEFAVRCCRQRDSFDMTSSIIMLHVDVDRAAQVIDCRESERIVVEFHQAALAASVARY